MEEELKDLLTCDVCLERFNQHERVPKALPCQHVLCQVCAQRMLGEPSATIDRDLECPHCRQVVRVTGSRANNLPDCIPVKYLMDVHDREQERRNQKAIREEITGDLPIASQLEKSLTTQLENHTNRIDDFRQHAIVAKREVDDEVERCIAKLQAKTLELHGKIDGAVSEIVKKRTEPVEKNLDLLAKFTAYGEDLLKQTTVTNEEWEKYRKQRGRLKLPDGPRIPEWKEQPSVTVDLSQIAKAVHTPEPNPRIPLLSHTPHTTVQTLAVHVGVAALPNDLIVVPNGSQIKIIDSNWKATPYFDSPSGLKYKLNVGFGATNLTATRNGVIFLKRESDLLLLHPSGKQENIVVQCSCLDSDWDSNLVYTVSTDFDNQKLILTSYEESGVQCEQNCLPLPIRIEPGANTNPKLAVDKGTVVLLLKRSVYKLCNGTFVKILDGSTLFYEGVRGFVLWNETLFIADGYGRQVWMYDLCGNLLQYLDLERTRIEKIRGVHGLFATSVIHLNGANYKLLVRRPAC